MARCAQLLVVGLSLCGAPQAALAQFSTADLAGTWSVFARFDLPSVNAPGETRGSVTLDNAGNFTGGSLTETGSATEMVTGGSLSVAPGGAVSGTLQVAGENNALSDLQLDVAGNLLVGTDTDPSGGISLFVAVRRGGSFSPADFTGDWALFAHFDERLDPHEPGWSRADITLNASGTITDTQNALDSDGPGDSLNGLDLDIDAAGTITITTPPNLSDAEFQMTPDKDLFIGAIDDIDDPMDPSSTPVFVVAVRLGSSHALADLEGEWFQFAFSDRLSVNAPAWSRSAFELDNTGAPLTGDKSNSAGGAQALSGGALGVDASGRVDGTLNFGTLLPDLVVDAQMNGSADFFAGVASGPGAPDDRRILSIALLPEPGAGASALGLALGLGALRRRP